jgi:2-polyprenyl-3-methyl-5-hydroxy-6-metoxy-1,4-benzoquinol methylase
VDHKPTIDEQRAFYDQWNVQHRSGGFEQIAPEIRDRGSRVLALLESMKLQRPRILEVGCGTGWLTEKLCALGEVTAIDLSPQAIEVARQRKVPAELIAGDFFDVQFARAPFDVVVCVETLFYVEDQPAFVAKLATLLRPGGTLALTAINKFVYERSKDVHLPQPGQIRNWIPVGALRKLLSGPFEIRAVTTIDPRGELGILRVVNAPKLDAALGGLIGAARLKRAKERLGLGGGVLVVARRRS